MMKTAYSWEALEENAIDLIGKQWMLVGAGSPEKCNFMTASWGGVGFLWNKPVVFVFVRPERYTDEFLEREELFSLNFFPEQYKKVLTYCGRVSGRSEDKLVGSGLTSAFTPEGVLGFEEAKLTLVCKKLYVQELSEESFLEKAPLTDWYGAGHGQLHKMYIAEICQVYR